MKEAANRPQSRRTPIATVAVAHRWGAVALWLILALLALLWALPVRAGNLEVRGDAAAQSTDFGLRVTPGSSCTPPNTLDITQDVSGLKEACDRITAGDPGGVTTTGSTTFKAGDEIVLRSSFTVAHTFTAIIASPLTRWAYVQDNSPVAEKTYNASFFLRVNSLTFANDTDRLYHFVGFSSDGTPWFRVVLRKHSNGEKRLVLEARKDNTNWESTSGTLDEVMLSANYNEIEINWSAGAGTGHFQVALDGGQPNDGLSGLTNSNAQIDYIKWGAVDTDPGATIDSIGGYLEVDEFSSWR